MCPHPQLHRPGMADWCGRVLLDVFCLYWPLDMRWSLLPNCETARL